MEGIVKANPSNFVRYTFGKQVRLKVTRRNKRIASFSVHGNAKSHKYGLVHEVNQHFKKLRRTGLQYQSSLVVLASQQYASWLEDEQFMSALVEPFTTASRGSDDEGRKLPEDIHVLAAAVDGLHPLRVFGDTPHGFSFYYANMKDTMIRMWKDKPDLPDEPKSYIGFHTGTSHFGGAMVSCKLPLANTVFQNGRQTTMFASRWRNSGPRTGVQVIRWMEKRTHNVNCLDPDNQSKYNIQSPLVPITAPRKILAGLGNIVSLVEVDGEETPASTELEKAVNELYVRRSKEGHTFPPGPVGVWALVQPPGPKQSKDLDILQEWFDLSSQTQDVHEEWELALEFKDQIRCHLQHRGRLYKILSGGGGWGKKRGLLSLDPDVAYSLSPGDEGLDSFIRSFESRNDGSAEQDRSTWQDVVAPGSYIQYFITPPFSARPKPTRASGSTLNIAFGVSESETVEEQPLTDGASEWTVVPQHFGAVSNLGIFIKSNVHRSGNGSKLSVPGSWFGYLKATEGY
ncbi:hypothetical protein CDEST_02914 [Colletotrichum destructivum]|uniref:V-type c subunit family protein n=1 Tax=Colletotrichum destructivum TaxID=34406 RepID=A0AAX4I3Q4_9PEZI|nr:hypothetical protein CDEST_02914 [Colletotrichum destructivum]